ncbi:MAG: hypothetical protein M3Q29_03305 [Chloroflexota bacterium]|nr:hypothetical protein [Chloroflexota bacterium]
MRRSRAPAWRGLAALLLPSSPLLFVLVYYAHFGGVPHFFLHTLMGWDVALLLLLTATCLGRPRTCWDGLLTLGLALYAMAPDFVYFSGPAHRDWMDVFLFHVALDEILPLALPVLAVNWVLLLLAYARYRVETGQGDAAASPTSRR